MNITIKAYKDEDGTGRVVITGMWAFHSHVSQLSHETTDTGIGMTPEELTSNLVRTL